MMNRSASHIVSISVALLIFMCGTLVSDSLFAGSHKKGTKSVSLESLQPLISKRFSFARDTNNAVEGFVTYAHPAKLDEGRGRYVAYVYVNWGDLRNELKKGNRPKGFYHNWDGYITCSDSLWISIVREFAFDNGKKKGKKNKKPNPRKGSGRDKLVIEGNPKALKWKAGVVGATDGLLIRISLDAPVGTGKLSLGTHQLSYTIKEAPVKKSRLQR